MTTGRSARFVARVAEVANGRAAPAGICPEALAVLDGYRLPERSTSALRRMTSPRQLAAARVMAGADNCSGDLARALLAATPASQRADDPRVGSLTAMAQNCFPGWKKVLRICRRQRGP